MLVQQSTIGALGGVRVYQSDIGALESVLVQQNTKEILERPCW